MSNKNKLAYEAQEPAFLRRLRAGQSELDGRSNVQFGRPQKSRLKTSADDDEDDPLIVDESGEFVEKTEWQERLKAEAESKTNDAASNSEAVPSQTTTHDAQGGKESSRGQSRKVVSIGGLKKRKAVKVVANEDKQNSDEEGDHADRGVPVKSMTQATEDLTATVNDSTTAAKKNAESLTAQPKKKKAKRIKLSFDEPQ